MLVLGADRDVQKFLHFDADWAEPSVGGSAFFTSGTEKAGLHSLSGLV